MMAENTQKKLFLLDAYALIFRAYYAFIKNPRVNSKGLNTSAIFGFLNSLLEIISKENPTHLAVVFDPGGPTFRHHLFPDYKAHRDETPEDIKKAVPLIKSLLEAMNISVLMKDGYEADDVIGTISKQAAQMDFVTYMVTPDKDYAQLVNDKVFIYKPSSSGSGVEILGVEQVKEKFSIESPEQVIDILGLWGDSSDNIPGCPGIGEKRAKEIIAAYKSIDGIYQHIDELKGKQRENLIEFRQQVELSRVLATIELNVPIEWTEEQVVMKKPNVDKMLGMLEELEFRNMTARIKEIFKLNPAQPKQASLFDTPVQGSLFDNHEPTAAAVHVVESDSLAASSFKTIKDVSHQYYLVDNEMAVLSLTTELSIQPEFCFDTETTGLDMETLELVGLSFSWEQHTGYYVPVPANREEAIKLVMAFAPIFSDAKILKIGQNLKFDILVLQKYGLEIAGPFFDTMVAHHFINPSSKHSMDFLSETYLHYQPVSIEMLIGKKGKNQGSMRDVDINIVKEYAVEDADVTFQLKQIFNKQLEAVNLTQFFNEVEMPLMKVLVKMETIGIKVDDLELNRYAVELNAKLIEIEKHILELAGENFNIASPKQVGVILFEKLNIDSKAKKTALGQYSTDEETLQKLKDRHEIVNEILNFRGLKKMLNTYVEVLPTLINRQTKRLHTSYNQAIVVTGRLSSTNPNLQNIPIRDEEGREIRKAFVCADDQHVFLSADYSQVELRLMAHFSKDEHLIAAFKNGEDIHTATAAKIFNIPVGDVTSDMRRKAKTANFGIIYGISAFGLAERLTISRGEAKALIDGYFENFPGVKIFMDQCINDAREKGYVSTLSGRRRYLPDINSRNMVVRGVAERNAINAPIQGTAADIIKMAMVDIDKAFVDNQIQSKLTLQVHDELNFDVLKHELFKVKALVKHAMENACKIDVPLDVEMGEGLNWLEAH